jgi:hypothetical protein
MNKAYFFAILLLIGGLTGCMTNTNDNGLIDVSGNEPIYVVVSKGFVDSFNDALYGTICDKLMYEDGSFYNEDDSSTCLNDADDEYNGIKELNAMFAPNWEYVNFENTGKKAALTSDIYKVSGIGIYCRDTESMKLGKDCEAKRFSEFYMAKNIQSDSGDWGYAAEGFRTTDGGYLEVVRPSMGT